MDLSNLSGNPIYYLGSDGFWGSFPPQDYSALRQSQFPVQPIDPPTYTEEQRPTMAESYLIKKEKAETELIKQRMQEFACSTRWYVRLALWMWLR